jgi:parvulin-like peptidyl-prolyl isomerase
MKNYRLIFLCQLLIFIFVGVIKGEIADRIVAIVDDKVITLSQLDKFLGPYLETETLEKKKFMRQQVLNSMINEIIFEHEAIRKGIDVTEAEIEAFIENMMKQKNLNKEEMKREIRREGFTWEEYREKLKRQIQRIRLINMEVKSHIMVTKEDIKKAYDENISKYQKKESVHIKQIFLSISTKTSPSEIERKKSLAIEIRDRLKKGESFSEVAKEFSEEPAGKEGGDLGTFGKGQLILEVEKKAFSMQVGEISEIIQSQVGLHIIKLLEKKEGKIIPIEEVDLELREKIYNKKIEASFGKWLTDLRAKAFIEIKL